jgi:hypothetical protein
MKVYFSARTSVFVGLLAVNVAWPAIAFAQQPPPLAEVARQEAERRKTIKTTQRVITTKDLPESAKRAPAAPATPANEGAHASPTGAPPSGDQAAGQAAPGDTKSGGDARGTESQWRGRITQARESVRRNEAFAEALQSRINALTTDFVNRDNPVQRSKIGQDRQSALDELAKVRSEIEQGKQRIADIEEEARKAGVPPGWLR